MGYRGKVVEQVVESIQYRDVATGFYVVPRLSGERVTLEIAPQREVLSRDVPGGVDVQRVATTVSGRLGEWLEVGGMVQQSEGRQATLPGRSSTGTSEFRRVLIKVEELR